MTRAMVTGGSGFIGMHLVKRLSAYGFNVTSLVRPNSDLSRLEGYRPRFIKGDVTDKISVEAAMNDVDVVFHLAGATKCLHLKELERANVEGVRTVAQACANCSNPPTLIVVSSIAASGPSARDRFLVEGDTPRPVSNYGRSKLAGENAAMLFADRVPITIIRPPIVLGEADRNGLTMFDSIARWNLHLVPGMGDELFSVIHGEDLAEAIILAFQKGSRLKPGNAVDGIYFATSGETPTYAELGRMVGEAVGRNHVHVIHNPRAVVWCIAAISELTSQVRRRPHIFGWDKAREATAGSWACDGTALRRETGFSPAYSLQQRIAQTARWYVQNGWLKSAEKPLLVH